MKKSDGMPFLEKYSLASAFKPAGDQPEAIAKLADGVVKGGRQTLLGVTGSGKTFTIANVIAKTGKTALVISHNKTLAAQLYSEFKLFFPKNKVGYFVSYYDYYQPESYLPATDTYIEKDAQINERIERMRLAATANLMSVGPSVIVATVSCIYGIGSPVEWSKMSLNLAVGGGIERKKLLARLVQMQYERNELGLKSGRFRAKGGVIDIVPGYAEEIVRVELDGERIASISLLDPINFTEVQKLQNYLLFPAKHYIVPEENKEKALRGIRKELEEWLPTLPPIEAHRLGQRTNYDLELIEEIGYCNGVENYSRHFDGRQAGQPPYCLLDFLPQDAMIVVDESHVTLPQLHGMYEGDKTRKKNLIDYGFRLPSAYDNRPLKWAESEKYLKNAVFVSATPGEYERTTSIQIVEQLVRPTGVLDPTITVLPTAGQMDDLIGKIAAKVKEGQRVFVTTLTKRMAEDLAEYLNARGVRVRYLHSEIETLARSELLRQLRLGDFDVLVGINLLREGLDVPEVGLVAILDADKEGFLRNETSLIQVVGRAARNVDGEVVMYADRVSDAMRKAIGETNRRRKVQEEFNLKHGITPASVVKKIGERLGPEDEIPLTLIPGADARKQILAMEGQMNAAAEALDFEKAIELRNAMRELEKKLAGKKRAKA